MKPQQKQSRQLRDPCCTSSAGNCPLVLRGSHRGRALPDRNLAFPPPLPRGYHAGMSDNGVEIRILIGFVTAAFSIWLVVRGINEQRYPLTFWETVTILVVLALVTQLTTSSAPAFRE